MFQWTAPPEEVKPHKQSEIEVEAETCRKAFADTKQGDWLIHCHHRRMAETLPFDNSNNYSIDKRIFHIQERKPFHERLLRLKLFRPVIIPAEVLTIFQTAETEFNIYMKPFRDKLMYYRRQQVVSKLTKSLAKVVHNNCVTEYCEAIAIAEQAFNKRVNEYHNLICPINDCPWTGTSIFKDEL